METIDYCFKIEFQFKNGKWLSSQGKLRVSVSATHKILKEKFVDYNILGDFMILTPSMHEYSKAEFLISRLKQELLNKGETYYGNENIGMEFKNDFCRPIDHLTPTDSQHGDSINWNHTTPIELQYIPTKEIFQLFDDWLEFLKEIKSNSPQFKS